MGEIAELAYWRDANLSADEIAALAKGFAPPRIRIPAFYAPLRRDINSVGNAGGIGAATDGSVTDHLRIIG